jgi:hypothetical protein
MLRERDGQGIQGLNLEEKYASEDLGLGQWASRLEGYCRREVHGCRAGREMAQC